MAFLTKAEIKRFGAKRPKMKVRSPLTGEKSFLFCVTVSDGIKGNLRPLRKLRRPRSKTTTRLTTQAMLNRFFKTDVPAKKVGNVLKITYLGPLNMSRNKK